MKRFLSLFLTLLIAAGTLHVFANDSGNVGDFGENTAEPPTVTSEGGTMREMMAYPPAIHVWPWAMAREFDSALERLFFIQFGEEFLLAYENSTAIGQTHRFGNYELEVIAAISYAGHKSEWPQFPENLLIDTEEAADMFFASDWAGLGIPVLTTQSIETHVFVSLSGFYREDGNISGPMLDVRSYEQFFGSEQQYRGILIHTDHENGRMYFVIRLHNNVPVGEEVDISFTVYRLLANSVWNEERANINLAQITRNHRPTFEVSEERPPPSVFTWLSSQELETHFGSDFNLFSEQLETMLPDELNIPIARGLYLTNLSHEGNVLRVQKTHKFYEHTQDGFVNAVLTDTRRNQRELETILSDWSRALGAWVERGRDIDDFNADRFLARLEAHNNRHPAELFRVYLNTWYAAMSMVTETAFLVERNLLNHLDFIITTQQYETVVPVDFVISDVHVPVMDLGRLTSKGPHRVFAYDRYFVVSDIEVSMLDITFQVHDMGAVWEIVAESAGAIGAFDLFDLELVIYDGDTSLVQLMGGAIQRPFVMTEGFPEYATFSMIVGLINLENVTAIIINGTRINLR